jgi:hypothetical protein
LYLLLETLESLVLLAFVIALRERDAAVLRRQHAYRQKPWANTVTRVDTPVHIVVAGRA